MYRLVDSVGSILGFSKYARLKVGRLDWRLQKNVTKTESGKKRVKQIYLCLGCLPRSAKFIEIGRAHV